MGEYPWGFRRPYTCLGAFMCQVLALVVAGQGCMLTQNAQPRVKLPRKLRRRLPRAT